jgi:serine peptidase DegS
MTSIELLKLLWQATSTGLALAFLWVVFHPSLLAPGPVAETAARQTPVAPLQSYAAAVQAAAPSVVSIYATRPSMLEPGFPGSFSPGSESLGSGVVVSLDGHILTNLHVVREASAIEVALNDGRRAPAVLIGKDGETDLAVLKAELPEVPLITIAEVDKLQVGDVVLAIGNPYGFQHTVTQGIVSATGRNRVGISTFENFIQTDAAINPGNSGGALVNSRGELLGIATAMISQGGGADGIGFVIPASMAIQVLHEILEHGSVRRGWLGIAATDLSPEDSRRIHLAGRSGVMVQRVIPAGPAEDAGLVPGDVLCAINGRPIFDSTSVIERITGQQPGTAVKLEVLRDGAVQLMDAVIGQRPEIVRER